MPQAPDSWWYEPEQRPQNTISNSNGKMNNLIWAMMKPAWRSMSERTQCTELWLFIHLLTWSDIVINLFSLWECLSICLFVSVLLSSHWNYLKEMELNYTVYLCQLWHWRCLAACTFMDFVNAIVQLLSFLLPSLLNSVVNRLPI